MAGSWHVRGRLTACWRLATPSSRKFVIRSIPISDAVASVKQSTLGEWHGSGRVAARERHGMCKSVFKTAGEQQGNGMGTAWERHGMCESAFRRLDGQTERQTNITKPNDAFGNFAHAPRNYSHLKCSDILWR
jgi:hypothetical protein